MRKLIFLLLLLFPFVLFSQTINRATINFIEYPSVEQLRRDYINPNKASKVYIRETNNIYYYDDKDKTTKDDGINVIVQASGRRTWKCVTCNTTTSLVEDSILIYTNNLGEVVGRDTFSIGNSGASGRFGLEDNTDTLSDREFYSQGIFEETYEESDESSVLTISKTPNEMDIDVQNPTEGDSELRLRSNYARLRYFDAESPDVGYFKVGKEFFEDSTQVGIYLTTDGVIAFNDPTGIVYQDSTSTLEGKHIMVLDSITGRMSRFVGNIAQGDYVTLDTEQEITGVKRFNYLDYQTSLELGTLSVTNTDNNDYSVLEAEGFTVVDGSVADNNVIVRTDSIKIKTANSYVTIDKNGSIQLDRSGVTLGDDDVLTKSEVDSIINITNLPIGGAEDQILAKSSNADYAVEWVTPSSAVTSVNSQTGVVVLDADDIDDSATAHKFVTSTDITKLSNTSGTNTGDQDISNFETTSQLNTRDTNNRNRSNHTGTQTASTISDFDSAVTANAAVTTNTAKVTNATHTGEVTGSTSLTIANDAVTNAKAANMAQNTIKGRITGSTGDPEDLTAANVRTITETETTSQLNTRDTNNRSRANHTGSQLASTISDFETATAATASVTANSAKVTNATHSGDMTGATALTAQPALITGKSAATVASGDLLLISDINDSNNLKQVTAQSIADLGGGGGGTTLVAGEGVEILDSIIKTSSPPLMNNQSLSSTTTLSVSGRDYIQMAKLCRNPITGVMSCVSRLGAGHVGAGDYGYLILQRSLDKGKTWHGINPVDTFTQIQVEASMDLRNPAAFYTKTGRLVVVWSRYTGSAWTGVTRLIYSDDDGVTWSSPTTIANPTGLAGTPIFFMPHANKIVYDDNGDLLQPFYVGYTTGGAIVIARSQDNGETWDSDYVIAYDETSVAFALQEPSIEDFGDGVMLMVCRVSAANTAGDFIPALIKSTDYGRNWAGVAETLDKADIEAGVGGSGWLYLEGPATDMAISATDSALPDIEKMYINGIPYILFHYHIRDNTSLVNDVRFNLMNFQDYMTGGLAELEDISITLADFPDTGGASQNGGNGSGIVFGNDYYITTTRQTSASSSGTQILVRIPVKATTIHRLVNTYENLK